MPFPLPAGLEAEFARMKGVAEEAFNTGDFAPMVDTLYHKDAKVMAAGYNPPIHSAATTAACYLTATLTSPSPIRRPE